MKDDHRSPLDASGRISEVVRIAPRQGLAIGLVPISNSGGPQDQYQLSGTGTGTGTVSNLVRWSHACGARDIGCKGRSAGGAGHADGFKIAFGCIAATIFTAFVFIAVSPTSVSAAELRFSVGRSLDGDPVIRRLIDGLKSKNFTVKLTSEGTDRAQLEATRRGHLDVVVLPIEAFADTKSENASKLAAILSLPFQFSSTEEFFAVQDTVLGDAALNDISDKDHLRAISLLSKGMSQLAANRPISSPKDLFGLRVQSLGEETNVALEKLGGQPVQNRNAVLAFSNKKIDAFEWIPQLSELAPPVNTKLHLGFRPIVFVLVANAKFWTSLNEGQRIDIAAEAKTAAERCRDVALRIEKSRMQAAADHKVQYVSFEPQQFAGIQDAWKEAFLKTSGAYLPEGYFKLFEEVRSEAAQKKRTELPLKLQPPRYLGQAVPAQLRVSPPPTLFATNRTDNRDVNTGRRFGLMRFDPDPFSCGTVGIREAYDIFSRQSVPIQFPRGLAECLTAIRAAIGRSPVHSVIVYFPGFGNTFEEAARHALEFSSVAAVFPSPVLVWSWPSDGGAGAYLADGEAARDSEADINHFVSALIQSLPDTKFHLVAHSMGARLVLAVMSKLGQDDFLRRVDSVVFVAGDINQQSFARQFRTLLGLPGAGTFPILTNYASSNDRALKISAWAHSNTQGRIAPRMGTGGVDIFVSPDMPQVQSIDASSLWGDFLFQHNYTLNQILAQDLRGVFLRQSPEARGLSSMVVPPRPGEDPRERRYWYFR